jgi:hypothetical protein
MRFAKGRDAKYFTNTVPCHRDSFVQSEKCKQPPNAIGYSNDTAKNDNLSEAV